MMHDLVQLLRRAGFGLAVLAACFLYGCEAVQDSTGLRPAAGEPDETLASLSGDGNGADFSSVSRPPLASPTSLRIAQSTPARSGADRSLVVTPLPQQSTGGSGDQSSAVATVIDARPAAMIDGKSVTWGELRPILNDLAGADALREYILDTKITKAMAEAGITVGNDDIAAERKMLLENLSDDPNTAIRLLDELRDRQNLGRARFESQLRRNAGLRAMVRSQVKINEDSIRSMHDIVHGPKRQARIMVLPDLSTAQAAINLVNSGASFADVAVEMSTDTSAARGGLLEPISQSDPNYPESLRQTIFSLNPGQMSGPVLVDDKYAVVFMVKRLAADGVTLDDSRPALERLVRISQERLLMDQLARRLSLDTAVTVFDEELNESWQRAKKK
jgi:parvulin-like peptidyl-prolyl isomerase